MMVFDNQAIDTHDSYRRWGVYLMATLLCTSPAMAVQSSINIKTNTIATTSDNSDLQRLGERRLFFTAAERRSRDTGTGGSALQPDINNPASDLNDDSARQLLSSTRNKTNRQHQERQNVVVRRDDYVLEYNGYIKSNKGALILLNGLAFPIQRVQTYTDEIEGLGARTVEWLSMNGKLRLTDESGKSIELRAGEKLGATHQ